MVILDQEYADFLIRTSNFFRAAGADDVLQILKVSEEIGEVADAVHRWKGTNPRKPRAAAHEVAEELGDVVVTALVAIVHMGFDPNHILKGQRDKTEERLRDHAP